MILILLRNHMIIWTKTLQESMMGLQIYTFILLFYIQCIINSFCSVDKRLHISFQYDNQFVCIFVSLIHMSLFHHFVDNFSHFRPLGYLNQNFAVIIGWEIGGIKEISLNLLCHFNLCLLGHIVGWSCISYSCMAERTLTCT